MKYPRYQLFVHSPHLLENQPIISPDMSSSRQAIWTVFYEDSIKKNACFETEVFVA